ncbi:hypothetical protein OC834_001007 [Tilletia horrida]|uniref:Transcription initiation factor IIF subunit beta n=1 Tax=Tilletia horrida TaxID=155126 RepID=A0AAN6GJR7_9BASI|nr:hypothetical protein OC834_001007 [Tilletia horrida]KAK0537739.1 hypothetical protein OC842_001535 [Tilletia horrida]KAK0539105.1 hypothetical protein OC835_001240 [Tilletia horrida]KAK0565326.1 hypothetical protein OC844_001293 [Tilletia horrida]
MNDDSAAPHSSPRASGSGSGAASTSAAAGALSADSLPFILSNEGELDEDDVPDEDLDVSSGKHQLWLVKVPAYLMNEWNRVKVPDVRLGTVRVYDELDASGKQRMELLLPPDWQPGTAPITSASGSTASPSLSQKRKASEMDTKPPVRNSLPKVFDLKLAPYDASAANLYAFREQWEAGAEDGEAGGSASGSRAGTPAEGSSRSRKRPRVTTALIGCVANETHVQAKVDAKGGVAEEVRQQLRRRRAEAEKKRSIQILDADEGTANMLASGVNVGLLKSRFGKFSIAKNQSTAKNTEKRARMPKNELLDMLWPMFESQTHIRLKALAERTQQPEAYLRDVLNEVADLHKRGPYTGHYSIKPAFLSAVHASVRQQAGASGSGSGSASGSAQAGGADGDGSSGANGKQGPSGEANGGEDDFDEVA